MDRNILEEMKPKFRVPKIEVKTFYIVISSMGDARKNIGNFIRRLRINGLRKRQLA
jgi:hypothetical protein